MATLRPEKKISTGHDATIHDIAYDYYGRRLATCSSDKTIRVFDKDKNDEWELATQWPAHKSVVWRVEWAHPEFGPMLASCSDDRTVIIWAERMVHENGVTQMKFQMMATLVEFQKAVTAIQFAPAHVGLMLATCCNDGKVRFHVGNPTNLANWHVASEFEPDGTGFGAYANCLSWNKSRMDGPTIVCGWWRAAEPKVSSVGVWGYSNEHKRWSSIVKLDAEPDAKGNIAEVRDVDWAPAMGRPHHLIAAAVGNTVQVWKLPSLQGWQDRRIEPMEKPIVLEQEGEMGTNAFWRVGWNLTGTTLAASAENGKVLMWKLDFQGQLKEHVTMTPFQQNEKA